MEINLLLGEGWNLAASTKPADGQYVICLRGQSIIPLLCVYHAGSGNFYQCFQKIGKTSTKLNLSIVSDIVAFRLVEGIHCEEKV